MHSKLFLCTLLLSLSFTFLVNSQLVYQEEDTNVQNKPQSHMRQPVTSAKCQEGELLYPGDNNGDWACDCRPAYLYYPEKLKCYEAFTRGPCKSNEILILPKSKFIPVCERNSCEPGKVSYNGRCRKIGSSDGCPQGKTHTLQVNATTIQLGCVFGTASRFGEKIDEEAGIYEEPACFLGGKRQQENTC